MKKLAISMSVLFLALGLLSGCGSDDNAAKETAEKAAEAAKEAAPAAAEATKEAAAAVVEAIKTPAEQAVEKAASEVAATAEQVAAATTTGAGGAVQPTTEQAAAPAATEAAPAAEQAAAPTATEAAPVVQAGIDGEKIYRGLCFSCHDMGVANAPKPGDKAAWEPRIATGIDALYASSLNGKAAMPAKGGNPALSDDEVKAAVDWMVAQSK